MGSLTRRGFLTCVGGAVTGSVWGGTIQAQAAQASGEKRRPNIVIILADDQGWGDLSVHGNTNLAHAAHRFAGPRRRAVRAVLRLPGLLADAGRVSHRPLSSARRRARRLDRRRAAEPRREDDRRRLQGGRLRHRRVRQVAQRQPVALSSQRPRLRRVLRLHLRPLGRVLRPAAGAQRQARARQGLHHRRPDRPRAGVHRAEQGPAVLLLPAVQHAALAVAGARPVLRASSRTRRSDAARPRPASRRTSP